MAYRVWFTETTEWYVELPDAATPQEVRAMVTEGDERVWDNRDYLHSTTYVNHMEEM